MELLPMSELQNPVVSVSGCTIFKSVSQLDSPQL